MGSTLTEGSGAPVLGTSPPGVGTAPDPRAAGAGGLGGSAPSHVDEVFDELLSGELLEDLDEPRLVLSEGYIGRDRRGSGIGARLYRVVFGHRRSLLRLELVLAMAVAVIAASVLVVDSSVHRSPVRSDRLRSPTPLAAAHPAAAAVPVTTIPTPTTTVPTPTTTTAPVPAAAPAVSSAATTPAQLGAEALTLVHYPWQSIPGYTIQFLPISDAPTPGFYGNTTFTWGHTGGSSVLYVYSGETVQRLAGITAFEIGHEVDASAVEPQGGETQIENILGIHPASWAPDCDCAEQGYLSGWYAAAFSDYWSPGVGSWSTIAPEPTGAVLTAIQPWLNPTVP
jgi:hypothetical protein